MNFGSILINNIKTKPFIRILFPFILGVILQSRYSFEINKLFYISIIVVFLLLLFRILFLSVFRNRYTFGVLLNLFFILSGVLSCYNANVHGVISNSESYYKGQVIESVRENKNSYGTLIRIYKGKYSYKILVYFEKKNCHVKPGDKLIFRARINRIKSEKNPGNFDYSNFLANKNIFYSCYLNRVSYKVLSCNPYDGLLISALTIRNKIIEVYKENCIEGDELAVLMALSVGDKSMLNDEIKVAYSNSGAMHVLAVSGLHVGVIALLLMKLLFFLNWSVASRILKAVLVIFGLWIFAFITGLSASVMRATFMFSLILIGKSLDRQTNIYHTIVVSMFILLCINPNNINNIGFWLSYLAVVGIIFFYPKIYNLFYVKNSYLDWFWKLTSVSIAAQLSTIPFSIYFFNKMPLLFWLSNFIVIPSAFFILYLTVLLLIVSNFMYVSIVVSYLLKSVILVMNRSILFLDSIPNVQIEEIYISQFQMLVLYFSIVLLSIFLLYKNNLFLFFFLLSTALFLIIVNINIYNKNCSNYFVVFDSNKGNIINFVNSKNSYIISDIDTLNIKRVTNGFWKYNSSILCNNIYIPSNHRVVRADIIVDNQLICFADYKFLYLNRDFIINKQKLIKVDIIIYTKNIKKSIHDIKKSVIFDKIIFTNDINLLRLLELKHECVINCINYYSIYNSGAFVKLLKKTEIK